MGAITVTPKVSDPIAGGKVRVVASYQGKPAGKAEGVGPIKLTLNNPQL
ncbi:MAG: hypothetical protein NTY15_09425 [Planctomycetota bacterium]|nr:hypothetical protein [Planctomycetota bacterium]